MYEYRALLEMERVVMKRSASPLLSLLHMSGACHPWRIARREHSSSAQDAGVGRACGVERSQKAVSWL